MNISNDSLKNFVFILSCLINFKVMANDSYLNLSLRQKPINCVQGQLNQSQDEICQEVQNLIIQKETGLNQIVSFSDDLNQNNLKHNLKKYALGKMLYKKFENMKLFAPTSEKINPSNISNCLDNTDLISNVDNLQSQLTNKSIDTEAQLNYLAGTMLNSLRAQVSWNDRERNIKKYEKASAKKEIALGCIRNPLSHGSTTGRVRESCRISTQQITGSQKSLRKHWQNQLSAIEDSINQLTLEKEIFNQQVLSDPTLVEETSFYEDSDFKPSKLMLEAIAQLKKSNSDLSALKSLFYPQKETLQMPSDQLLALSTIADVDPFLNDRNSQLKKMLALKEIFKGYLKENPTAKERLLAKLKTQLQLQSNKIDESIKEICDSDGETLHHYSSLVNEVKLMGLKEQVVKNKNLSNWLGDYNQLICQAHEKNPINNSSLAPLLAGAGLFAAAGICVGGALFTAGGSCVAAGALLAAGGATFVGHGLYETWNVDTRLDISSGLAQVNLDELSKMREDVSDFRLAATLTGVDAVATPLAFLSAAPKLIRMHNASKVLERPLSQIEKEAIWKAHLAGRGATGKNGNTAQVGNYTIEQIREKARILKEAGLSTEERRRLMEFEIVGVTVNPFKEFLTTIFAKAERGEELTPEEAEKFQEAVRWRQGQTSNADIATTSFKSEKNFSSTPPPSDNSFSLVGEIEKSYTKLTSRLDDDLKRDLDYTTLNQRISLLNREINNYEGIGDQQKVSQLNQLLKQYELKLNFKKEDIKDSLIKLEIVAQRETLALQKSAQNLQVSEGDDEAIAAFQLFQRRKKEEQARLAAIEEAERVEQDALRAEWLLLKEKQLASQTTQLTPTTAQGAEKSSMVSQAQNFTNGLPMQYSAFYLKILQGDIKVSLASLPPNKLRRMYSLAEQNCLKRYPNAIQENCQEILLKYQAYRD